VQPRRSCRKKIVPDVPPFWRAGRNHGRFQRRPASVRVYLTRRARKPPSRAGPKRHSGRYARHGWAGAQEGRCHIRRIGADEHDRAGSDSPGTVQPCVSPPMPLAATAQDVPARCRQGFRQGASGASIKGWEIRAPDSCLIVRESEYGRPACLVRPSPFASRVLGKAHARRFLAK